MKRSMPRAAPDNLGGVHHVLIAQPAEHGARPEVGRGGGGFVSAQLGDRQHGAEGLACEQIAIEAWPHTVGASELG